MSIEEMFSGFFGQVIVAGGGGALVAFVLFRFLGESWIKHRLATDLEAAKSEISLLAARRLKLHDEEYVVFPEVWAKLNTAVTALGSAVGLFRELPDLDRMDDQEFQKWLERSSLNQEENEYISNHRSKNDAYIRVLDINNLNRAFNEAHEFRVLFREKRIFIDPEIKEKLQEVDDLIHRTWVDRKMSLNETTRRSERDFWSDAWESFEKKLKPSMVEIENLFQKKLFPVSKNEKDK